MILGFVCLMLGKNSKHILPNGGFDDDFSFGKKFKNKTSPSTKNSNVGLTSSDIYDLCLANQRVILDSGPMNKN